VEREFFLKTLITGVNGFVGRHVVAAWAAAAGVELFGLSGVPLEDCAFLRPYPLRLAYIDLRDPQAVAEVLADFRPDWILHLAAQASVQESFRDPWATLENNIKSQVNLLEGLRKLDLMARVLVVSSAEVYGQVEPAENPIREEQPFRPANPYSVSKVAQDLLGYQYFVAYGLPIIRVRAFNHVGPGQSLYFALPSFAQQIAEIEATAPSGVIRVGNLSAERDFTDVRDVVRAYRLLLERGQAGGAYNVCSGNGYTIGDLLERMCRLSAAELRIEVDPQHLRPVDTPRLVGDGRKIRQDTGWQPQIDIQTSLHDILEDARQKRRTNA
jgi:GDP-4-dehydro-6-deoxy-D-mannose reductase